MKSVEELRRELDPIRGMLTEQICTVLDGMLNHIDRLNGRSDIMADVQAHRQQYPGCPHAQCDVCERNTAEGHMVILRAEDVVPIDVHQKLRRDFVRAYRELVMLNAAVADCEAARLSVASIRHRQNDLLAQDDEYQRAIRIEGDLRRHAKTAPLVPDWIAKAALKIADKFDGLGRMTAQCIKIISAEYAHRDDLSVGDPIVDHNSYNVPDQYDRMDFRELREAIITRGGLYVPAEDTPSQTEEMRRWLRDDDAVSNAGCLVYPPSIYIDERPDPRRPHTFVLDNESGLNHTTYRVCKCELSEFNVMHTREDTNAKTNQTGSQT